MQVIRLQHLCYRAFWKHPIPLLYPIAIGNRESVEQGCSPCQLASEVSISARYAEELYWARPAKVDGVQQEIRVSGC